MKKLNVLEILIGVNIWNNNTVIPVLLRISTTKLLPFCYPLHSFVQVLSSFKIKEEKCRNIRESKEKTIYKDFEILNKIYLTS